MIEAEVVHERTLGDVSERETYTVTAHVPYSAPVAADLCTQVKRLATETRALERAITETKDD